MDGRARLERDVLDGLVTRAACGDEKALRELLENVGIQYLRRIAGRKFRHLPPLYEPEDLVQDSLLRLWSTFRDPARGTPAFRGRTIGSFVAFLKTIAERELIRRIRRKDAARRGSALRKADLAMESIADNSENGPQRQAQLAELRPLFKDACAQLSAADQEILRLRALEQLSYTEIATRHGRTSAACRNHFARAKLHLAAAQPSLEQRD